MKKFNRRTYENISIFVADLKAIIAKRDLVRPLIRGKIINGAFRERLMLAFTAVNGCTYCTYAHARRALVEGLDEDEVTVLKDGMVEDCPTNELPGLLYAQHWEETHGRPAVAGRERLIAEYDEETVRAIELTLQTLQMGNLLGDTMDWFLYRVSRGHLGV